MKQPVHTEHGLRFRGRTMAVPRGSGCGLARIRRLIIKAFFGSQIRGQNNTQPISKASNPKGSDAFSWLIPLIDQVDHVACAFRVKLHVVQLPFPQTPSRIEIWLGDMLR